MRVKYLLFDSVTFFINGVLVCRSFAILNFHVLLIFLYSVLLISDIESSKRHGRIS